MPKAAKVREPVPFAIRQTLRWSRPNDDKSGIVTTFPKPVAEREARQRGISVLDLVRDYDLEFQFGVAPGITVVVVKKASNGR